MGVIIQKIQVDFDHKQLKFTELEKELAITTDQRNQLQKNLIIVEDKIEALRQEKLFLTQEKAQLQGLLEQFEKMKNR
jgi:chromosome segregation ATPase